MRLVREPLFHFLVLGGLVFVLYSVVSDDPASSDPKHISVTAADIEQLEALWAKQWHRPPTPAERRSMIEDHVREQVLYREALALGLDQNDTILRRRLAQKMEFLITDLTVPVEPAEQDLRAYHRDHSERYVEPARVSFTHVYFSPDRRGEQVDSDARQVLETLQRLEADGSAADGYGDVFMLRSRYQDAPLDGVARDFGRAFASGLLRLALERWQGPLASGYGVHLVYVSDAEAARPLDFEEARRQVENDYRFDRRREAGDAAYRRLRDSYRIVVEDTQQLAAGTSAR